MKCNKTENARIQAERWAYEFHAKVMCDLPAQIRHNIDWDLVADDLQSESPEDVPAEVIDAIKHIVDFLYREVGIMDGAQRDDDSETWHVSRSVDCICQWLHSLELPSLG